MTEPKDTPSVSPDRGESDRTSSEEKLRDFLLSVKPSPDKPHKVILYPGRGFVTHRANSKPGNNNGLYGKREKITGWSASSRRRLRMFMMMNRVKHGHERNVTLTIPGPVLPYTDAKRIFKEFARRFQEEGGCAVWRVEIQQRKQLHWHLCASMPLPSRPHNAPEHVMTGERKIWDITNHHSVDIPLYSSWETVEFHKRIFKLWKNAVDNYGTFDRLDWQNKDGDAWSVEGPGTMLSDVPGFYRYGVHVGDDEGGGAWVRYMMDHISKVKQDQIPVNIGRHWGVIGKERFLYAVPEAVEPLTYRQFFSFLRMTQRLATRSVKAGCIFGKKLAHRPQRGNYGRFDWFSNTDTCKRLLEWARSSAG